MPVALALPRRAGDDLWLGACNAQPAVHKKWRN